MIFSMLVLLTGCSQLYDVKPKFTRTIANNKSNVIFNTIQVTGSPMSTYPGVAASIYDITNDLQYIGTINNEKAYYGMSTFLEYSSPLGKRTFMITYPAFPGKLTIDHADFVEVDVQKGKASHISIEARGLRQLPYFIQVNLTDKDFNFCSELPGTLSEKEKQIYNYMSLNNMHSNDFFHYCRQYAGVKQIITPNNEAFIQFQDHQSKIILIKENAYTTWKTNETNKLIYDIEK